MQLTVDDISVDITSVARRPATTEPLVN